MFSLDGQAAFVTGAGQGLGAAIAQGLAEAGAGVMLADIDAAAVEAVAASLRDAGHRCIAMALDVRDEAAFAACFEAAVAHFGAIDVMVNNAGVMPLAFWADHAKAADAWSRCIDINLKGVMHGIIAVHDQMIAQGRGHVINLSSIYGNFPVAGAKACTAGPAAAPACTITPRT